MKTLLFTIFITLLSTFTYANEAAFNGVKTSRSYKDIVNHNPATTVKYSADPGVMVYNDRVYVYSSNDGIVDQLNKNSENNGFSQIKGINVMSSEDLVNWTDHGTIPVAGSNGLSKWAINSWAPHAAHKKINGKEKFFLYFANAVDGIGVLTSDSPSGPFIDPLGKPLISRSTPTCKDITWLFDPAVLVDDDGTGYLYFGGGVPDKKKAAAPNTFRVVKLGADMISLAGNPVLVDVPWGFEDSGINKYGNTYYFSYCTNWERGPYGNARIAYMTSTNPLGPFTYQDVIFNNPGTYFRTTNSNNHHTIVNFKNKWYIFYHSEWLNKEVFGELKGYRTTHVDELPFSNGKFSLAKGTRGGVPQLSKVDPYTSQSASTFAWNGGVTVNGLGFTTVSYNKGDWTGVSGVNFSKGASSIKVRVASKNGAAIRITANNENGDVIGYVTVPATGGDANFKTLTAEVKNVNGAKDIFFTASGDLTIDTWQFFAAGTEVVPEKQVDSKIKNGWYYIRNPETNKYIQVIDGRAYNKANVVIGSGREDDAQRWYVTNLEDGYITLKSALGEFMLDVADGSDANNANIRIFIPNGADAQQFLLYDTTEKDVYIILTRASRGARALDIERRSSNENTNILQWTNENKANQFWAFEWDRVNNPPESEPEPEPQPEKEKEKETEKPAETKPEPEKSTETKCWSKELGYKCCTGCAVYSIEGDQEWGVENGEWCGILPSCKSVTEECWSEALGYKCCKGCNVYSVEGDQQWGIEDNQWCGILPSCNN